MRCQARGSADLRIDRDIFFGMMGLYQLLKNSPAVIPAERA
jgi:hypothetical protein